MWFTCCVYSLDNIIRLYFFDINVMDGVGFDDVLVVKDPCEGLFQLGTERICSWCHYGTCLLMCCYNELSTVCLVVFWLMCSFLLLVRFAFGFVEAGLMMFWL
jgi:hypothetical protein